MSHHRWPKQRGGATLIVTLLLFFVMTLVAAFANRNHVFEQRASANQVRATQAFEAAEAGIEWASALLNEPRAIDERCLPTAGAPTNFRERYLVADARTGQQTAASWSDAGKATSLRAACVRDGSGWACSCPASAAPRLAAHPGEPSFVIEFASAPQPGVVQLLSTGTLSTDATAHVQVTLGLIPGLVSAPIAPLTVKGSLRAGTAALGLHNADAASGGFTAHAGASVDAPSARLSSAPGGDANASIIEGDSELAATSDAHLFSSFFGLDKALWSQQPGVTQLSCAGACAASVLDALTARTSNRRLWIEGDMTLDGPLTLGSREHPVILVVRGAARFNGAVVVHGVVYAASLAWNDAAAGAGALHGAAISESGYEGNGAPDLVYDAGVLAALATRSGSFARVPGSWRDF